MTVLAIVMVTVQECHRMLVESAMVSCGTKFSVDASLEIIIVYTPWGVLQCLKTNYSLKQHIKVLSGSFPKWNQWLLLNIFTPSSATSKPNCIQFLQIIFESHLK